MMQVSCTQSKKGNKPHGKLCSEVCNKEPIHMQVRSASLEKGKLGAWLSSFTRELGNVDERSYLLLATLGDLAHSYTTNSKINL